MTAAPEETPEAQASYEEVVRSAPEEVQVALGMISSLFTIYGQELSNEKKAALQVGVITLVSLPATRYLRDRGLLTPKAVEAAQSAERAIAKARAADEKAVR